MAESRFDVWFAQGESGSDELPPTDPRLPVLVVGAGPAGLAGMAALQEAGVDFVAVESHGRVGGIWDVSNPLSSVYEGMRTVTSRFTTHLGPPVPADRPHYLSHEQAHEYLARFAEQASLVPRIRFETEFVGAEKTPEGTWRARLRSVPSGEVREQEFRACVFATGAHHRQMARVPSRLKTQAEAAGLHVLHSADYKTPAPFAGKRVLIVGIGNSGSDIADKISTVAARTLLAVRTSPWINPQTAFGVPCDKLAADTPAWLPEWYRLGSFHVIRWLSVGGFRRLGLTTPRHSLNDRLPIGDRGITRAIRSGRVLVRSNVVALEGGRARFENPSHREEAVDAVIFSTGFIRAYPLLCQPDAPANEVAEALMFLIFHRREPGLSYLAESVGLRGCWPIFLEQARAMAAYYAAESRQPAKARSFNRRRGVATPDLKGPLFQKADAFHVDYDVYTAALRKLAAWLAA